MPPRMKSEFDSLNFGVLVEWGLPLSDVQIQVSSNLPLESLRAEIAIATKIDFSALPESRERSAVLGFLWAVADHYPSLFPEIDRQWLAKFPAHNLIKLRRLSLQGFSSRMRAGIDGV